VSLHQLGERRDWSAEDVSACTQAAAHVAELL